MNNNNITEKLNSQNLSHWKIEHFEMSWAGIPFTVRWEPDCHGGIISHLEIRSKDSQALPITGTGYLSHFTYKEEVLREGWPERYVQAWLRQEADAHHSELQTSLF